MNRLIAIVIFTVVNLITFNSFLLYAQDIINVSSISDYPSYKYLSDNSTDNIPSNYGLVLLRQSDSSESEKIPYMFSVSQSQWENSKDLTNRFGFLNIDTNPKLLNEIFLVEGQMAYSPAENVDIEQGFRQYAPRMYRFNFKGKFLGFEYGAAYRTFDIEFEKLQIRRNTKDKAGKEFWIKRKFGIITVKTFISDYLNNIYFDPSVPRIRKSQYGTALEISVPSLPILNFSYSRGTSKTIRKLDESGVQNDSNQNFNAYIYYWRTKWDVSLSSSLTLADNKEQSDFKSIIQYVEISGSYRPDWTLVLTPTIGIMKENYDWLGGGINYLTKYASISLSYFPGTTLFGVTLYGYYSNYISSDTYTDTSTINGYTDLALNLGRNFIGDQKLSFEVGYFNYLDNVFSMNNYNDFTALVAYKISGF